MDENTQGNRSQRTRVQSEKAMNSDCNVVKNLFKSNSSPELIVNKNTEHNEEISEDKTVKPSQEDASQMLSLTQNSQVYHM